jgi:hypothetical protein
VCSSSTGDNAGRHDADAALSMQRERSFRSLFVDDSRR